MFRLKNIYISTISAHLWNWFETSWKLILRHKTDAQMAWMPKRYKGWFGAEKLNSPHNVKMEFKRNQSLTALGALTSATCTFYWVIRCVWRCPPRCISFAALMVNTSLREVEQWLRGRTFPTGWRCQWSSDQGSLVILLYIRDYTTKVLQGL